MSMRCPVCGRVMPEDRMVPVAQVSNPVTWAWCCRGRLRCLLTAFIRIWRQR